MGRVAAIGGSRAASRLLTDVNHHCGRATQRRTQWTDGEIAMMDVVMLALGLGFFALSVGYAIACDRL
jgi:hypothetical protein